MTTQNISLRERVYTAIAHQSLLVANGVYSLCDMSMEDLRWLYEQIGECYIAEKNGTNGARPIVDLLRVYGPEIMDSQSSSDLELCGRMRIVQADAFKIANTEE
jgi:hypothetical protein